MAPRGSAQNGAVRVVSMLAFSFDLPTYPLRFEYLPAWAVLAIFLLLAIPVARMGRATIRWQGAPRGWTVIGVRLAALWLMVLMIGGAHWERRNKDLEVIILRDVSASTASVPHAPGTSLLDVEDDYLKAVASNKPSRDRVGVVSFDDKARIDAFPSDRLRLTARRPTLDSRETGTDIAAAVQTGLASFHGDCMRRLVLVSDGNVTQGDTSAAIDAAMGAGVAVDVVPLSYKIANDVMIDRVIAPARRRESQPITLDVVLRSTNARTVDGKLMVTDHGQAIDLDCHTAGVQPTAEVYVGSGIGHTTLKLPPLAPGMHSLAVTFESARASDDVRVLNNSAEALTFVTGRSRVLYVEHVGCDAGALPNALKRSGFVVDLDNHVSPDRFPTSATQLQGYDCVILANVPRGGADGLNLSQERALVQYVRDLGGGLVVVGGPQALGAGQWQGSELEKVLPVSAEPARRKNMAPGALVIVLDHSGSMIDPMGGQTKQQAANAAAARAIESLSCHDYVGVIAFNTASDWVVPLATNAHSLGSQNRVMTISPGGGTSIAPALQAAYEALAKLSPEQAGVRHILLMTDGVSEPAAYATLLSHMAAAKITLSTVAVGSDADVMLLGELARRGGGLAYAASDPKRLDEAFVRDAQTLRRPLIVEPPGGIDVVGDVSSLGIEGIAPKLAGMALTSPKPAAHVDVLLASATGDRDPVLARWQCGLGRCAVFTGDATKRWAGEWVGSPVFEKFWPSLVRSVARSTADASYEVRSIRDGTRTRIIVEATGSAVQPSLLAGFSGKLTGPDSHRPATDIRLAQTGVGVYETTVDTPDPGTYFASLQSPASTGGMLIAPIVVNASAELRDLQSNDALLTSIASRTGGRVLPTLDASANLFSREGLTPTSSSQPIEHILLPMLMATILLDVAVRRLAWDWQRTRQLLAFASSQVHNFFATRSIESVATVATLRKMRRERAGNKFVAQAGASSEVPTGALFIASRATDSAKPQAVHPPGPRGYAVCLMAAKQRAREQIHQIGQNR